MKGVPKADAPSEKNTDNYGKCTGCPAAPHAEYCPVAPPQGTSHFSCACNYFHSFCEWFLAFLDCHPPPL
eukprot:3153303-Amphidinium_carterae.1